MDLKSLHTFVFFVLAVQARPIANWENHPSRISSQAINSFYEPYYAQHPSSHLPALRSDYSGVITEVTTPQPASKFSHIVKRIPENRFSVPHYSETSSSIHDNGKNHIACHQVAEKIKQFEREVIETTKQHLDRLEPIAKEAKDTLKYKSLLEKVRQWLKRLLQIQRCLKGRLYVSSQHSGIPYYTSNEDHIVVKKPEANPMLLEMTSEIVSKQEVLPEETLKGLSIKIPEPTSKNLIERNESSLIITNNGVSTTYTMTTASGTDDETELVGTVTIREPSTEAKITSTSDMVRTTDTIHSEVPEEETDTTIGMASRVPSTSSDVTTNLPVTKAAIPVPDEPSTMTGESLKPSVSTTAPDSTEKRTRNREYLPSIDDVKINIESKDLIRFAPLGSPLHVNLPSKQELLDETRHIRLSPQSITKLRQDPINREELLTMRPFFGNLWQLLQEEIKRKKDDTTNYKLSSLVKAGHQTKDAEGPIKFIIPNGLESKDKNQIDMRTAVRDPWSWMADKNVKNTLEANNFKNSNTNWNRLSGSSEVHQSRPSNVDSHVPSARIRQRIIQPLVDLESSDISPFNSEHFEVVRVTKDDSVLKIEETEPGVLGTVAQLLAELPEDGTPVQIEDPEDEEEEDEDDPPKDYSDYYAFDDNYRFADDDSEEGPNIRELLLTATKHKSRRHGFEISDEYEDYSY